MHSIMMTAMIMEIARTEVPLADRDELVFDHVTDEEDTDRRPAASE